MMIAKNNNSLRSLKVAINKNNNYIEQKSKNYLRLIMKLV